MSKPNPPRTIRELLAVSRDWLGAKGVTTARLDAEILLCHVLQEERLALYTDMDRPLSDKERDALRPLLARRGKLEPVAYIVGEREFYSLAFTLTPDVLVPRPDTEVLVDRLLELVPEDAEGVVVDVGTGSGCIAVAIAHQRPGVRVIATDVSAAALGVAAGNVARHGLGERVELREGDALTPVADVTAALAIVGNPPYIREDERATLMSDVVDHEPALALFGEDDDGLGVHRRILAGAAALLADDGVVALEAGYQQAQGLRALPAPGLSAPDIYRDLAGHERGGLWRRQTGGA